MGRREKRRKPGPRSSGAGAGVAERGKGRGRKPGGRPPPEQSAAGSRPAVVRLSRVSPESLDPVGRSAGPGGAVQAGEAGLKGPIPGDRSRPAGIQLRPGGLRSPVRGRWAAGEGPLPRSRCTRRLWLCSERPWEPHLPLPGPYSTVEVQNTSLQLKIILI